MSLPLTLFGLFTLGGGPFVAISTQVRRNVSVDAIAIQNIRGIRHVRKDVVFVRLVLHNHDAAGAPMGGCAITLVNFSEFP